MMKLALHVLLSLALAGIITSVVFLRQTSVDSPEINAIISTISSVRSSLRTLLAPPYIYLLLNLIIISIAASSSLLHRYFPHNHHHDAVHSDYDEFNAPDPLIEQPLLDSDANSSLSGDSDSSISVQFVEADNKFDVNLDETWSKIADENRKESRLRRSDGDVRSKLGQLVENDDGDGDTLEALWKSIAEENKRKHSDINQIPPLLSKADLTKPADFSKAWDAMKAKGGGGGGERRRRSDSAAVAAAPRRLRKSESNLTRGGVRKEDVKKEEEKELRKSETFNDAVSARRRGGMMLRRDPSLSVDELNGRVEAFINNFNHQMRLQRQESEQRFLDMMKRGV